ncbi:MAG: hypothetical protein MR550_03750 [Bacilli bacterium]|nr:hypothetical protein [Bacilli bacterium]
MDFTKLSYQQILNCASVLNTCAINMDMILNVELRDLLDKIGDENFWSGASAQRLKEELDSLKEKFPIFSEDIKECSNNLTKMVEEYQKADAEINNM